MRSAIWRGRQAEIAAVDLEVLAHRQVRVEVVLLRHEPDPRLVLTAELGDGHAEHAQLARARRGQAHDHAHRGGLAGAVRPEQPDAARGRDLEVEAADGVHGAVGLLEPSGENHWQIGHGTDMGRGAGRREPVSIPISGGGASAPICRAAGGTQ